MQTRYILALVLSLVVAAAAAEDPSPAKPELSRSELPGDDASSAEKLDGQIAAARTLGSEGGERLPALLLQRSRMAHSSGDLETAQALLQEALDLARSDEFADKATAVTCLGALAELASDEADFPRALALQQEAIEIAREHFGEKSREHAELLREAAIVTYHLGDYSRSRQYHEASLPVLIEVLGPDHEAVGSSWHHLGMLQWRMNDLSIARESAQEAVRILRLTDGEASGRLFAAIDMLANVLQMSWHLEEALVLREEALELALLLGGPDHENTGHARFNIGALRAELGDYHGAVKEMTRACAILAAGHGESSPVTLQSRFLLALLHRALGDVSLARRELESVLAGSEAIYGPDHPQVAATAAELATTTAAAGDFPRAFDLALRAERAGREHLRLTAMAFSEREALAFAAARPTGLDLALTLARTGDSTLVRRSWNELLRSRAVVLEVMTERRRNLSLSAAAQPLLDTRAARARELAQLRSQGPGPDGPEAHARAMGAARTALEAAERSLAAASSSGRSRYRRQQLDLDDVGDALGEGEVLVAYTTHARVHLEFGEGRTLIIDGREVRGHQVYSALVLRRGEEPRIVELGLEPEIDELVSRWRDAVQRFDAPADVTRGPGEELRRTVWDPLLESIGEATRVFVVPDGALHSVPLAALPAAGGGWLLETGPTLHSLSAERDLVEVDEAPLSSGGLLALGGVDFDAASPLATLRPERSLASTLLSAGSVLLAGLRGGTSDCTSFRGLSFDPLPATAEEARTVARTWRKKAASTGRSPKTVLLTGERASEFAFKTTAPGRRVLHVATHGFFLGECNPAIEGSRGVAGAKEEPADEEELVESPLLRSGLALAGFNRRAAAGEDEEDGVLTADEVAALDLSGVEWAVLSACDTGRGQIQSGEGVLGLQRAFRAAGARTVVMSLWSVPDEETRLYMDELYAGRLRRGLDTSASVRAASLAVLEDRRRRGRSEHPFYWGAFVASGDWR